MFKRTKKLISSQYSPQPSFEGLEQRVLFSGGYSLQTIAKVGDSLPNPADGGYTSDFEPGKLNARGQLVFTSEQGKPLRDSKIEAERFSPIHTTS